MSKVTKYDEMMVEVFLRQIQDHLRVVGSSLIFTDVQREIIVGVVDELYELLNKED